MFINSEANEKELISYNLEEKLTRIEMPDNKIALMMKEKINSES